MVITFNNNNLVWGGKQQKDMIEKIKNLKDIRSKVKLFRFLDISWYYFHIENKTTKKCCHI